MRVVCANHSSYPRVAEGPKGQRLRRAYARRETGEIDDTGYRKVVADYVAEIVKEQEDAGCDVVTDGLVGWYDLINRPATHLDGVRSAGIVRWFDTNTYVRQPEIVGHPSGGKDAEFDRPTGSADEYFTYNGKGGVAVGSLGRRLLYSLKYRNLGSRGSRMAMAASSMSLM